jgi:PadR family transcriptional regulator PadR
MRGMLSFMILFLLSKHDMYGQEIADEIGRRKGERPNPGTIYPALKDLAWRRLVSVESRGRRNVYSLTKEGSETLGKALEYFARAYGDILVRNKSY